MAIDRDSSVPPSKQIAAELRARIVSGEIPPGRRIPSLTELEQTYDVARDTLRKAVRILRDEGLVETVQGMGIYVIDKDATKETAEQVVIMGQITDGPVPKYAQLAGILRRRIESGALAPGDSIPSETALEAEFGLARGTIRKAVAMLREEGVIVTTRGKGSYVADQNENGTGE